MNFKFAHYNFNVKDLERSKKFYEEALGLREWRRKNGKDGEFTFIYMTDDTTTFNLELTWLRDFPKDAYDLGDNEIHLAMQTDDYEAAHEKHKAMGCICYENEAMGLYFISDPDGYWIEIMPVK